MNTYTDRQDGQRKADPGRIRGFCLVRRMISVLGVSALFLLVTCLATGSAAHADPVLQSPEKARGIALGLIDATGPLAVQCGLGKIGDKIRARNVATAAVKDSIALSGAKKSCSGVKQLAEGIGVIAAFSLADQPVFISIQQSQKNKPLGLGLVKICTVNLRVGASEQLAKTFTAKFTCH